MVQSSKWMSDTSKSRSLNLISQSKYRLLVMNEVVKALVRGWEGALNWPTHTSSFNQVASSTTERRPPSGVLPLGKGTLSVKQKQKEIFLVTRPGLAGLQTEHRCPMAEWPTASMAIAFWPTAQGMEWPTDPHQGLGFSPRAYWPTGSPKLAKWMAKSPTGNSGAPRVIATNRPLWATGLWTIRISLPHWPRATAKLASTAGKMAKMVTIQGKSHP